MPWIVPLATVRSMSRLARTAPKLFEMPTSSIAGAAVPAARVGLVRDTRRHRGQEAGQLSSLM